jgi:hypothetical protein
LSKKQNERRNFCLLLVNGGCGELVGAAVRGSGVYDKNGAKTLAKAFVARHAAHWTQTPRTGAEASCTWREKIGMWEKNIQKIFSDR